ncbi:IclR family transcriptional regulator [Vineibacter terrae]|uniref:IclR family transcriptional regulator n=1 Tax=Vineibacter terrae TaxID=2586908 RepID=A0A5C8PTR2_9HYPH|nr:IclR family transcriptional regulator [Vineibacter terrae]TXL81718.1 IclR family transcriptional regulator [Vineibacter terrae]
MTKPTARRPKRGSRDEGRDSPLFVRSVEKAMTFIAAFDAGHRHLSLSQLAERVGTDMSTAQRFVYTLEKLGLLRKAAGTRLYEVAPQLLNLGHRYLVGNELIERATPTMLHLSKTTEATINLMVPDGVDIVYISRFHSRNLVNAEIMIGARLPMFATASGMAILARMPPEDAEQILASSNFTRLTNFTETRLEVIRKRLADIRKKGYAVAYQETSVGDISVASAILGADGAPVAGLGISTSTLTMSLQAAENAYAPLVMAAASSLSQRL